MGQSERKGSWRCGESEHVLKGQARMAKRTDVLALAEC
jgi:hypothetical protein